MPTRILFLHNYYQQRGGEDESFESEVRLLKSRGHDVVVHTVHNDAVDGMSRLALAATPVWSRASYGTVRALLRQHRPDVLHCNNTFPLLSPSVYYAARAEGVPVVQHLRNYRLGCVNGLFFRDGHVCEDCLGARAPWRGVQHGCYRGSRAASAAVAAMVAVHRAAHTWTTMVDTYVTMTEFAKDKLVQSGLPADRIVVKPNFLDPVPAVGSGSGGYAVFAGRLSSEKGLQTLFEAWERLGGAIELKVIGDGPEAARVERAAAQVPGVSWLGRQPLERVHELMGEARLVVFPSEWFETFGRVAMESFAMGTPVVAADIGAVAELVDHGRTGLRFRPGDPESLAEQVGWALAHPDAWQAMRAEVRREFEARFTADATYETMVRIYERVTARPAVAPARRAAAAVGRPYVAPPVAVRGV
ncbi:glycosyltransferase family 4 protein [Rubrivirga marina]|uniref:Glycosyl transferase family 1 n=1 Tax=Rubrivirga marina TaxID=1196024 RepID=A0A271IXJ5_9BACT|nr:glycosyltransferase family 4 protein [Rubrivirga marina]PAP75966.1 glycosyl transferase family 1 [Rubrivirga marina]